jgi:crotonobetainyl-CoA:carnitine CoA-transferase CaiB-like acyl-CoA transferase
MDNSSAQKSPLYGVRILDLTRVISGPYATMMLADMGADIVKIEEPLRGDEMRWIKYKGRAAHDEDYFNAANRSKRSITLNMKDAADQLVAQQLAVKADVVIENYAPGVADRLGMGWGKLSALNSRLIYCSISGFGQTGPYRSRPALDPIIQALSGVMSVTGYEGQGPLKIGAPLADVISGMFAAFAVSCAWVSTKESGKGQHIDISMQDAMMAVLGPRMGEALQAGIDPSRHGNATAARVPADTYLTLDDRHLVIMVLNDTMWGPFCKAMDKPEWFAKTEYRMGAGRVAHKVELNRLVAEEFRKKPAAEWEKRLEQYRIPYGFVNSYLDAINDPQVAHRGLVKNIQHPVSGDIRVIGAPWKMTGIENPAAPPPVLGQHTAEVLQEWLSWPASRAANFHQAQEQLRIEMKKYK